MLEPQQDVKNSQAGHSCVRDIQSHAHLDQTGILGTRFKLVHIELLQHELYFPVITF